MAGGKNKIHEHPKANTNGFDKRPQDAGFPKGEKHKATILREVLSAKGKKGEDLDPLYWFASEMYDIYTDSETRKSEKIVALEKLINRFFGMPTQEVKQEVTGNLTPQIVLRDEEAVEQHKKMEEM